MKKLELFMMVLSILTVFCGCKDDDGLTEGDPNYFTSSRGQFTTTIEDEDGNETTLFLIPGKTDGTAVVTFDGDNPRHWGANDWASIGVKTYQHALVIPERVTVDGKTFVITAIGDEAFLGCRAFARDNNTSDGLTSLQLPETVTSFGEGSFALSDIAEINIPQGVTAIPRGCFSNCRKLVTITVPANIKTIDEMAYYYCDGCTTLTIEEGVETIGEMAFFDCYKLTEVTIPASVTTIGNLAFGGRSTRLSKIAAYHMQSATPPTLEGTLYQAAEGIEPVIYVPAGASAAYKAAAGWSNLTIEEE